MQYLAKAQLAFGLPVTTITLLPQALLLGPCLSSALLSMRKHVACLPRNAMATLHQQVFEWIEVQH